MTALHQHQGGVGVHIRSCVSNVLASTISFLMVAVIVILNGDIYVLFRAADSWAASRNSRRTKRQTHLEVIRAPPDRPEPIGTAVLFGPQAGLTEPETAALPAASCAACASPPEPRAAAAGWSVTGPCLGPAGNDRTGAAPNLTTADSSAFAIWEARPTRPLWTALASAVPAGRPSQKRQGRTSRTGRREKKAASLEGDPDGIGRNPRNRS